MVIPHFGCGPTLCAGVMPLDSALLRLLDRAPLSLPFPSASLCASSHLSVCPFMAHRLGSGSGIVQMPEKEFGCDMFLEHYSSSWHYMCRDWQCLAALVRMRSSDSGTTGFTRRATKCLLWFLWAQRTVGDKSLSTMLTRGG